MNPCVGRVRIVCSLASQSKRTNRMVKESLQYVVLLVLEEIK